MARPLTQPASSSKRETDPLLPHDMTAPREPPKSLPSRLSTAAAKEYFINAGPLTQLLVRIAFHIRQHPLTQRFWKPKMAMCSIGPFCIKRRTTPDAIAEAHAMRLVAANTSVPVPKVYCAFVHDFVTWIVESKIRGHWIGMDWDKRSEASKARLLGQLRDMTEQIRNIKRPAGEQGICDAIGGSVLAVRLPGDERWGPFPTTLAFHTKLTQGIDPTQVPAECYTPRFEFVRPLMEFYRDYPEGDLVFTHVDLSCRNILVDGDDVTGIVDWEAAGWFPSYWEYTQACIVQPFAGFWRQEVDRYLTPRPHELAMERIREDCFGEFGGVGGRLCDE